ncbi:MAG TPA: TlyA family RNA methyltransferase [Solirubrobacterales bacterium]|nr:TlyA family RNA methyltransferase [Solirubrobacterales bacterium]
MARRRLDTIVAERGLAPSRSAAATSIRAGLVRIGRGGARASKPSQMIDEETRVEIDAGRAYVSRGGHKLASVLDRLAIDVGGLACVDIGASTGGFTDCLLRRGAASVLAIDVGRGQLDWGLRNDERVTVLEGFNARELGETGLPEGPAPDLVTIDVSFISASKILAPLAGLLPAHARVLVMVKPQFELGKGRVGSGGVVRDPAERLEAVLGVAADAEGHGLFATGVVAAGLPGPKGNVETFLLLENEPGAALGDLRERAAGEVG